MSNRQKLALYVAVFLAAYFISLQNPRVQTALWDTCGMLQDCARADSLFLPCARVFTAGGIAVFIGRESVMMYLGM